MKRKCSICLLILFTLIIYGICLSSIRTYYVADHSELKGNGIESSEMNAIIQNKLEHAYEISNDYITESMFKKQKIHSRISDDYSKFILGLFEFPKHFKYYMTESINIMENNSSLVQKSIIQYLNSKDGVK